MAKRKTRGEGRGASGDKSGVGGSEPKQGPERRGPQSHQARGQARLRQDMKNDAQEHKGKYGVQEKESVQSLKPAAKTGKKQSR